MGNLTTPDSVQKLQTALHAKAKAEPGYRFYALYDKISREDILAHAYAQCRSNKGAPGVDGQDFEAVEAYGVERWLGELALALRQETYRPDPIRRVFIPKANGKLRPLGISTLRDRVCMTAAMLVLEPIFEADLPSELYAYRPGRNANGKRPHAGGQSEPHAARMGELLRGRNRQQGVSSARCLRGDAVAPVVALQAQSQAAKGRELSTLAPLRALRAPTPEPAWARRAVDEGVRSCPRAGCGRSACPVR